MRAWKAVRGAMGGTGGAWGAWVDVSHGLDVAARAALELTHGRKFIWAKQNNLLVAYLYEWPVASNGRRMIQLVLFRGDGKAGIDGATSSERRASCSARKWRRWSCSPPSRASSTATTSTTCGSTPERRNSTLASSSAAGWCSPRSNARRTSRN